MPRSALVALVVVALLAGTYALERALRADPPLDAWTRREPVEADDGEPLRFDATWRENGAPVLRVGGRVYEVTSERELPATRSACEVWGRLELGRVRVLRADCYPFGG